MLVGAGLFLIAVGLIKKMVIADELARRVVDPVFADPARPLRRRRVRWRSTRFAAQIYCDFSGYTDMAIGLALLLGFELPAELRPPLPGHEPAATSGGAGT